jgi:Intracellular proteinase inhibitor
VIQARIGENIVQRSAGACFGVWRSEDHTRDSSVNNGASAHRAGFHRAVQGCAGQPVIGDRHAGIADGGDFRMCGRILARNGMVAASANNVAILVDNHGANRHLAGSFGAPGFAERHVHVMFVRFRSHGCMLNYFAMKWFRSFAFLLLLAPAPLLAQGVRMSEDFLPLAVGNHWVYDVVNEDGKKLNSLDFFVQDHTIVKGRSFYILSGFPFVMENGSQIHFVRYDKTEKQFVRVLDDVESPLFLADGASTEVIEADSTGLPMKFVLNTGFMAITFQRGVGIIEARIQSGNGLQIAKIASARVGEGVAPPPRISAAGQLPPTANPQGPQRPPTAAQAAGIPEAQTPQPKAVRVPVNNVGSITDDNPLLTVQADEVPEGHHLVVTIKNNSDKLLPFAFTTPQTFDFAIIDPATGREIWRWSQRMMFVTTVKRTEAIPPQGQWKFDVVWNHRDNDLNPVPHGTYNVVAFVATKPAIESESITIEIK